jgi:hypothetical protein
LLFVWWCLAGFIGRGYVLHPSSLAQVLCVVP